MQPALTISAEGLAVSLEVLNCILRATVPLVRFQDLLYGESVRRGLRVGENRAQSTDLIAFRQNFIDEALLCFVIGVDCELSDGHWFG